MFIKNGLLLSLATSVLATHGARSHPQAATSKLAKRYTFPIPDSQGSVTLDEVYEIDGETFDGGMKTYGRGVSCTGQDEGGDSDAVFIVKNGGTLKNVIIGSDQIEGVHCEGSCTIENVWWEAVCEDALSLKTGDGPFNVVGGGAQGADDKVIQHNGGGTVTVSDFTVYDFGKLYRSCGNCDDQYERHIVIEGVTAVSGKYLVGINSNYGDTATIDSATCATDVKTICAEYEGTDDNDEEPEEISDGPSDYCIYSEPLSEC
ncbi:pectate lyase H [Aspergillus falconensis]